MVTGMSQGIGLGKALTGRGGKQTKISLSV